jgi:hypothetical protein
MKNLSSSVYLKNRERQREKETIFLFRTKKEPTNFFQTFQTKKNIFFCLKKIGKKRLTRKKRKSSHFENFRVLFISTFFPFLQTSFWFFSRVFISDGVEDVFRMKRMQKASVDVQNGFQTPLSHGAVKNLQTVKFKTENFCLFQNFFFFKKALQFFMNKKRKHLRRSMPVPEFKKERFFFQNLSFSLHFAKKRTLFNEVKTYFSKKRKHCFHVFPFVEKPQSVLNKNDFSQKSWPSTQKYKRVICSIFSEIQKTFFVFFPKSHFQPDCSNFFSFFNVKKVENSFFFFQNSFSFFSLVIAASFAPFVPFDEKEKSMAFCVGFFSLFLYFFIEKTPKKKKSFFSHQKIDSFQVIHKKSPFDIFFSDGKKNVFFPIFFLKKLEKFFLLVFSSFFKLCLIPFFLKKMNHLHVLFSLFQKSSSSFFQKEFTLHQPHFFFFLFSFFRETDSFEEVSKKKSDRSHKENTKENTTFFLLKTLLFSPMGEKNAFFSLTEKTLSSPSWQKREKLFSSYFFSSKLDQSLFHVFHILKLSLLQKKKRFLFFCFSKDIFFPFLVHSFFLSPHPAREARHPSSSLCWFFDGQKTTTAFTFFQLLKKISLFQNSFSQKSGFKPFLFSKWDTPPLEKNELKKKCEKMPFFPFFHAGLVRNVWSGPHLFFGVKEFTHKNCFCFFGTSFFQNSLFSQKKKNFHQKLFFLSPLTFFDSFVFEQIQSFSQNFENFFQSFLRLFQRNLSTSLLKTDIFEENEKSGSHRFVWSDDSMGASSHPQGSFSPRSGQWSMKGAKTKLFDPAQRKETFFLRFFFILTCLQNRHPFFSLVLRHQKRFTSSPFVLPKKNFFAGLQNPLNHFSQSSFSFSFSLFFPSCQRSFDTRKVVNNFVLHEPNFFSNEKILFTQAKRKKAASFFCPHSSLHPCFSIFFLKSPKSVFHLSFQNFLLFLFFQFRNPFEKIFMVEKIPSRHRLHRSFKKWKYFLQKSKGKNIFFCMKKLQRKIDKWWISSEPFFSNPLYGQKISRPLSNFCDFVLQRFLWTLLRKNHPNKSKTWIRQKYFHCVSKKHWFFGKKTSKTLFCFPLHSFSLSKRFETFSKM